MGGGAVRWRRLNWKRGWPGCSRVLGREREDAYAVRKAADLGNNDATSDGVAWDDRCEASPGGWDKVEVNCCGKVKVVVTLKAGHGVELAQTYWGAPGWMRRSGMARAMRCQVMYPYTKDWV